MRKRSLSPRLRSLEVSKFKRKSVGGSTNRRPVSSDNQGAYDKLLKTSFIMSNIRKSIKQNDLKYLIGEKREKLRTEPSGDREWAQKVCHETLIDIRRRYDAVKRQRIIKLQQTEKLKERVKTYSFQQSEWKEKIYHGREHTKTSEKFMQSDKMEVQFKLADKKVLQHMKSRLKQEIEHCKARIIIQKRKLGQSQLSLRSLFVRSQKLSTQTQNAANLLIKATSKFEDQESERVQHLSNLKQMINQRDLREQKQQQRVQYEDQQAEKALLAKNEEQQGWHLLFMTHTFLKKMLINKMTKEKEKFRLVEQCFINIRSRTEVKEAEDLVERFLNRDKTYGELLSEVAKTKDRHSQLKQEQAKLLKQNAMLEEKSAELFNSQYVSLLGKTRKLETGRPISVEADECMYSLKKRVKQWLLRQMIKISRLDKRRYEYSHNFSKQSVEILFMRYLQYLNDISTREEFTIQNGEQDKQKDNGEQLLDNKSFISTYMKTKFSVELKNNSKLIGSVDNQTGLIKQKECEQPENYKVEEETAAMENQRQEILQGNSKYMRELRNRFRDMRQRKVI